jgi:hypothetical protein
MYGNCGMNCSNPIDVAVLADYWLAALTESEEETVEEHLLDCDRCGTRLREIIELADGVRNLARGGTLRMVVSDAFIRQAAEAGLHVREYVVPAGGSVQCTVTAEDDLLIGRLAANLSNAKRLDLCICDDGGIQHHRLQDIPFNPSAGSVVLQESIRFAKAAPTNTMVARLVAFDEVDREQLIGEYTFNHTRTLPGPGGFGIS